MTNKNNISKVNKPLQKALLLLLLFLLTLPCFALTLEGGVTYTEETARVEAFEGVSKYLTYQNTENFNRSLFIASISNDDILKVIEYKANYRGFPLKYIGVVYKDEPHKIYAYKKQQNGYKGECVVVYKKEGDVIKTANYDAQSGKLMCVGIATVEEEYKYNENGKLIGYWRDNKFRSTDKKINATSRILYYSP